MSEAEGRQEHEDSAVTPSRSPRIRRNGGYGLDWLPLELADFERHGPGAGREPAWEGLLATRSVDANPSDLEVVECTTESWAARASKAFEHWKQHSNGRVDAREYLASGAIGDGDLRTLIVQEAPSFAAGARTRAVRAMPVELAHVWGRLYRAANSSTFYGPRPGAGLGRLHAWQSIAALSGAAPTADPTEVADRARVCRWFALDVASDWFWGVWWLSDVALACVGPESDRFALLAATDTD